MSKMEQDADGCWLSAPIDGWGVLYRTPYFVMPKLALGAMPHEWQRRFIALVEEMESAGLVTPEYYVLRAEAFYTTIKDNDEDLPVKYTNWSSDPWSNYRRGDAFALSSEAKEKA